jgi:hypothetical protein
MSNICAVRKDEEEEEKEEEKKLLWKRWKKEGWE